MSNSKPFFIAAGSLTFIAALLHVLIIIGGPDWYRLFGAGEQMAQMAEQGDIYPTLVTSFITGMLSIWACYAFAAAGWLRPLPLMKWALLAITTLFMLRGLAGLTAVFMLSPSELAPNSVTFWWVSSIICTIYGLCYLIGLIKAWRHL